MDYINEIDVNKHVLRISNGITKSYGTGMADMGGYATVYIEFIKKDEAFKELTNGKNSNVKYYSIKELEPPNEEYLTYLKLKSKYER